MHLSAHDISNVAPIQAAGSRAPARLPPRTVRSIEDAVGGDPVTEGMILLFIADKYGVRDHTYLPAKVAAEILRRPADFIRAAKKHCEPELPF